MPLTHKKLFYAVEAVLYIAYNAGRGPIASRDVAQRQGLPARYLEQIMQRLVRAGVLRGVRGPRGGYLLAKERRRVTVGEICEVLSRDRDEDGAGETAGTPLGRKVVRPLWERVQAEAMERLKEVNLADLCEQAAREGVKRDAEERMDFTI